MLFIIVEYIEKKICDVFNIKTIKVASIMPINDTDSDSDTVETMSCSYSTQEDMYNLV
jgi:hypothetical protein